MSSALTGNKIKDSYQALLKMGTNGSLDPTVPISITDGLGNDTPLQLAADKLLTNYLGNDIGLGLDFANSVYTLGDPGYVGNGNYIGIDNIGNGISLNSQNTCEFYALNVVALSSKNKQTLRNDGDNQIISTSNDNGTYSGERGIRLNFANDVYQFGDFDSIYGYSTFLQVVPGNKLLSLINSDNLLELDGNYNNVWLGYYPGSYNFGNDAVVGNYMFGTDWLINNNDSADYLFQNNTILNCYNNNLDTSDKAMSYNFFSNIKGTGFTIPSSVSIQDNQNISNCFIFGVDTSSSAGTFYSHSRNLNETNTNVVLLNGKGFFYSVGSTNIFSVNASGTFIEEAVSGITILGGDFYYNKDNKFIPANHTIDIPETYCINITGIRAAARNSFSNVFATRLAGSNANGQVQVEQIQLSAYVPNGSDLTALTNAIGYSELYVQSSSTYQVEAKIVSTVGNGDKTTTGNCYINATWKVCVDNNGGVDIGDFCTGCQDNPLNATQFELVTFTDNYITLRVAPDIDSQNSCYVKALITLNCITTG